MNLQPMSLDFHGYTPLSSYQRTIPCPDIRNTEFYIKPNIYDDVKIFFNLRAIFVIYKICNRM